VHDAVSDRTYLNYTPPTHSTLFDKEDEEVLEDLNSLANRLKLVFAALSSGFEPNDKANQIHAVHIIGRDKFGDSIFIRGDTSKLPGDASDTSRHYMLVNACYAKYAGDVALTANTGDFTRFTFSLAFSMAHEVAHAYFAHIKNIDRDEYEEPFLSLEQHNQTPELGYVLESALSGDTSVIKTFMDPDDGVEIQ
jgi:hypothetical protein